MVGFVPPLKAKKKRNDVDDVDEEKEVCRFSLKMFIFLGVIFAKS